jgi:hypothetical protein
VRDLLTCGCTEIAAHLLGGNVHSKSKEIG